MKRLGVTLLLILISGCAVNDPVDELLETWRERDRKNEVLKQEYRVQEVTWHPEWSDKAKEAVLQGKFILGMTSKQVKVSLGHPEDINKTVGSWGTHEQWVYSDKYLYFENGILTAWQD